MAGSNPKRFAGLVLLGFVLAGLAWFQIRNFRQPYRSVSRRDTLRQEWIDSATPVSWKQARPNAVLSPVVIDQIGLAHPAGPLTADGKPSDWIELLNISGAPVSLNRYSLTDSDRRPRKWILPDITLPPGGRLLVWADGQSGISSDLSFKYIGRRDIPGWKPRLDADSPSGYVFSGRTATNRNARPLLSFLVQSPETADYELWLLHKPEAPDGCVLEVWVDNKPAGVPPEPARRYMTASRLLQPARGDGAWNLRRGPHRVDVLLRRGATAADRIVLTVKGETYGSGAQDLHAPFKLNRAGETVALHSPAGLPLDYTAYPELQEGQTWRRDPTGTGAFAAAKPAPLGKAITQAPRASHASGIWPTGTTIELSAADPRDHIRYTTNGALPTAASPLYESPLVLTGSMMLNARAFREDGWAGAVTRRLYYTGPAPSLPLLWCQMRPADFIGNQKGFLKNPYSRGPAGERIAHACLIFPDGTIESCDAGLSLQGRSTRQMEVKKSFRLACRERYGAPLWPGAIFEGDGPSDHSSVVLIGHSIVKHPLGIEVMNAAGNLSPRARHVLFQINDSPMGIYVMLEDPNDPVYLRQVFGHLDLDVLKVKTHNPLKLGTEEEFDRTWGGPSATQAAPIAMARLKTIMEPRRFARWIAGVQFLGMTDNQQGYFVFNRRRAPPAWTFINWDLDGSMDCPIASGQGLVEISGIRGEMHRQLMSDPEYRAIYAQEFLDLLDTTFQSNRWLRRVDDYRAMIENHLDFEFRGNQLQNTELAEHSTQAQFAKKFAGVFDYLSAFFRTQPGGVRQTLESDGVSAQH